MRCLDNSQLTLDRIKTAISKLDFYEEYCKSNDTSDIFYRGDIAVMRTALDKLAKELTSYHVTKEDWLNFYETDGNLNCPYDMKVIQFIGGIRYHLDVEGVDVIDSLFSAGYCWHFAQMLKSTFNRGKVVLAHPYSHVVWVDTNNVAYDIHGVYYEEGVTYISFEVLGDIVYDFKHIKGYSSRLSEKDYNSLIDAILNGGEAELPLRQTYIDIWERYCKQYNVSTEHRVDERKRLEEFYGTPLFYEQLEKDLL